MKNTSDKLMYIGFLIFAASVSVSMSAQVFGVLIVLAGWIAGLVITRKILPEHKIRYFDIALFAFMLVLVFSTVFSINIARSFQRFTGFIGEVVLYFAVLNFAWNKERLSKFARIMIIFALIESAYGILQYFTGISFLNYGEAKKLIHPFWRIFGTWDYFNSLGGIMGMIIPVSIFTGIYSQEKKEKYFYLVSASVMIICLFFTFTRGAWLGVAFSVIVLGFEERKKLLVILLLCVIILFIYPVTRNRILMSFDLDRESNRLNMWKTAVEVIKHRPFLGDGLETFRDEFYSGFSRRKWISRKTKLIFITITYISVWARRPGLPVCWHLLFFPLVLSLPG